MSETRTVWHVGGNSVRGASHIRRNLPNQDAIGWAPADSLAAHLIAVVADGHGAPMYTRSQDGSRFAVQSALAVLGRVIAGPAPEQFEKVIAAQVAAEWRKLVLADVSANADGGGDWVETEDDKLTRYGSTLVATAITENFAIALQIGDGDLYWADSKGRVVHPLPDDEGLVGEQTYSLSMPKAENYARVKYLRNTADTPLPCFAMLSTDGVAKSFADEAAFQDVVRHYFEVMTNKATKSVLDGLPNWLEKVSQSGSGDDVTLCLAALKEP